MVQEGKNAIKKVARYVISTDRHGGVSQGAFASLNLSYGVGDEPALVRENRRRLRGHWSWVSALCPPGAR